MLEGAKQNPQGYSKMNTCDNEWVVLKVGENWFNEPRDDPQPGSIINMLKHVATKSNAHYIRFNHVTVMEGDMPLLLTMFYPRLDDCPILIPRRCITDKELLRLRISQRYDFIDWEGILEYEFR